jgi:hypothetical protein
MEKLFDRKEEECINSNGVDVITHQSIPRTNSENLVKLSDKYCYVRKPVKRWIITLIERGLRLGDEDFVLPTRVPINADDLRKLYIPIPEPAEIMEDEEIDVELPPEGSDMYGPLNVWNINRNSMYNPGGRFSRYNSDGTERGYESDASDDSMILGQYRNMYELTFNEETPSNYSIDDISRLLRERDMGFRKRSRKQSRKIRRSVRKSIRRSRRKSRKIRRSIRKSLRRSRRKSRKIRRSIKRSLRRSRRKSRKIRRSIKRSIRKSIRRSRRKSRKIRRSVKRGWFF